MSRYLTHYNKLPQDIPYHGESYAARVFEYTNFPYTYAYDVPNVINYPRSVYGRGRGSVSEYGYRSPYSYRSELFGYKYTPYLANEELEYYRDPFYPRYSRYRPLVCSGKMHSALVEFPEAEPTECDPDPCAPTESDTGVTKSTTAEYSTTEQPTVINLITLFYLYVI